MADPLQEMSTQVRRGLGIVGFLGILLVANALVFEGSHGLGLLGLACTFLAAGGAWRLARMRDGAVTLARETALRLKANEELLRSTLDAADVRVFLLDAEDRIMEVYHPPDQPLLHPREWFIGKRVGELGLGSSLARTYEAFLPLLRAGQGRAEADYDISFPEGSRRFHAMATARVDHLGGYIGCIVVSRDVTEQHRQADAIRESEAKFRSLYEGSSDAILLAEEDRYLDCNMAALMMFGYASLEEFRGVRAGDLSAASESDESRMEQARQHMQTALEQGTHTFEWRQRRKDGSTFESEVLMTKVSLADRNVLEIVVRDISERKAAERALIASRERFRVLFETSPIGFLLRDRGGRILESNRSFQAIVGRTAEELRHLTTWDMTPASYQEIELTQLQKLAEQGAYGPFEKTYLRKDGTQVPVRLNGMLVRDSDGEERIWSVVEDITNRKAWERELQARENRLQALIQHAPVGIFEADLQGGILFANDTTLRLCGLPEEAVLGGGWASAVHPEDVERVSAAWSAFVTGEAPYEIEFRVQRPDESEAYVETRATRLMDREGRVTGYLGTVLDLSSRREAEKEMAHLASILTTTTDFIATFDPEGYILYLNPAGRSLLGYPPEQDLHNISLSGLIPPSATDKILNEAIPTAFMHKSWSGDTAIITVEGEEIPVNQIITAHKGPKGMVEFYSTSLRDISDRVRIEAELRHHRDHLQELVEEQTVHLMAAKEDADRANQSKSTFLANMSHELRTPVHAIVSFSDLGLGRTSAEDPATSKLHRYFENVHAAATRLLLLLNDLLDLSKLEAGRMTFKMEPCNLKVVLQEALTEVAPLMDTKGLHLDALLPETPTEAMGDPLRLGQVVRNLLGNAIKFSPPGSRLKVTLAEGYLPGGRRAGDPDEIPAFRFTLEDEGPGIPPEELEAVFDPFIQSSKTKSGAGGTGLGLPISREIMVGHRGRIWAENGEEKGARFTFLLPKSQGGSHP